MVPNDDILSGEDTQQADGVPAGTPPGNGSDPQPQAGLSLSDVSQLLDQMDQRWQQRFEQIAETMRPPAPAAKPVPQASDDFLTEFSTNPRGSIERVAAEMVAPTVNRLTSSAGQAFVELEQQRVDSRWGPGAFEKHIAPHWSRLEKAYRETNPAALADRGLLNREINSLVGMQADALIAHKTETDAARTRSETEQVDNLVKATAQRVGLSGGLRPIGLDSGEPTREDLASVESYVDKRVRSLGGKPEDPKTWLRENVWDGNDIEAYRAHKAALAAKGK